MSVEVCVGDRQVAYAATGRAGKVLCGFGEAQQAWAGQFIGLTFMAWRGKCRHGNICNILKINDGFLEVAAGNWQHPFKNRVAQ